LLLQVLRQKRMYEGQRETLYNQQFNMEQTRFTVESIQDTVQTVQALKAANVQMKGAMKANKELDLSFIDNLQVGETSANSHVCVVGSEAWSRGQRAHQSR
jgi:hypothetical protein